MSQLEKYGMPYKITQAGGGFKVTTPNHPGGFSKHAQSKQGAEKQRGAIMANTHEDVRGNKVGVKKKAGEKAKKVGVRRAK